jgi:hypothetical protein
VLGVPFVAVASTAAGVVACVLPYRDLAELAWRGEYMQTFRAGIDQGVAFVALPLTLFAAFSLALERLHTDIGARRLLGRWALAISAVVVLPLAGLRLAGAADLTKGWVAVDWQGWRTGGELVWTVVAPLSFQSRAGPIAGRIHHCCTDAWVAVEYDLDGDGEMDCLEENGQWSVGRVAPTQAGAITLTAGGRALRHQSPPRHPRSS